MVAGGMLVRVAVGKGVLVGVAVGNTRGALAVWVVKMLKAMAVWVAPTSGVGGGPQEETSKPTRMAQAGNKRFILTSTGFLSFPCTDYTPRGAKVKLSPLLALLDALLGIVAYCTSPTSSSSFELRQRRLSLRQNRLYSVREAQRKYADIAYSQ